MSPSARPCERRLAENVAYSVIITADANPCKMLKQSGRSLPAEAKSLPARYYIDPNYYRAELEWFFFGMWIHAGRADEIPNPGDFVVRDVAGESLIIVRRDDGELSAYYNVCGHRGTRLTEQKSGRFASTIQCPYHAWTYDLKGCLMAAPKMERVTGFCTRRLSASPGGRRRLGGQSFSQSRRKASPAHAPAPRTGRAIPRLADGRAQTDEADRLRRRRQLEADHSQLFGMPPLPGGPPRAAKAVALLERRKRAGRARRSGRPHAAAGGDRHPLLRRPDCAAPACRA